MTPAGKIELLLHSKKKQLAVLIDPDKWNSENAMQQGELYKAAGVDFLLVGGSLNAASDFNERVEYLRKSCPLPLVLFPGHPLQLTKHVDATLFL